MYYNVEDITSTYFKKVMEETKSLYVERVNEWYISYAKSLNVNEDRMVMPVPYIAKDVLSNKLLMMYALDHMDTSSNGTQSFYQLMYATARDSYNSSISKLSKEVIEGIVNSTTTTSVFGTRTR